MYEVMKRFYGHASVYKMRPHDEKGKIKVERTELEASTEANDFDDESAPNRLVTRSQTRHKVQTRALHYIQEAMTSTLTYLVGG